MSRSRARVMVTESAGFVRTHWCDHFMLRGLEVRCVDDLLTGSPDDLAHIRNQATHVHFRARS